MRSSDVRTSGSPTSVMGFMSAAGVTTRSDATMASDLVTSCDVVTSSALHKSTREALVRVREGTCLAITHYNELEGYLVPAARLVEMTQRLQACEARERELRESLPLVLAAAQSGVDIPSESLERIAPGLDTSWRAVAEFASQYPLHLHRGEHGEPLTRGRLRASAGPIEESGDDAELNLDQ